MSYLRSSHIGVKTPLKCSANSCLSLSSQCFPLRMHVRWLKIILCFYVFMFLTFFYFKFVLSFIVTVRLCHTALKGYLTWLDFCTKVFMQRFLLGATAQRPHRSCSQGAFAADAPGKLGSTGLTDRLWCWLHKRANLVSGGDDGLVRVQAPYRKQCAYDEDVAEENDEERDDIDRQ